MPVSLLSIHYHFPKLIDSLNHSSQAYHSAYNNAEHYRPVANMIILPIRSKIRGPAPPLRESLSKGKAEQTSG
ncbi:uncharacterized protein VP01_815g1 [Puccinia sorghi]|uniref:Uncharacterized protein n=1 Tax=Puccinia sorghi TaxID=27349 RepID=A0A0L6UA38_9BASI|nr:uncharacterized protein VP01_815g1 [Puccinia sorghi]